MGEVILAFGFGVVGGGLPAFCGLLWWMRRCERLVVERDSLAVQLANAMMELRTVAMVEFVEEMGEGEDEDDDDSE